MTHHDVIINHVATSLCAKSYHVFNSAAMSESNNQPLHKPYIHKPGLSMSQEAADSWWNDFLADCQHCGTSCSEHDEAFDEPFDNTIWSDSDHFKPIIVKYLEDVVIAGDLQSAQLTIEPWKASRSIIASALTCAVDTARTEIGSWLLKQGVTPNKYHYQYAMKKESYAFLELYLDYGFDVNEFWSEHTTPLDLALHSENLTRWLLEHGANPDAEDNLKITPLSRAIGEACASLSVIRLLLEHRGLSSSGLDISCIAQYSERKLTKSRLSSISYPEEP